MLQVRRAQHDHQQDRHREDFIKALETPLRFTSSHLLEETTIEELQEGCLRRMLITKIHAISLIRTVEARVLLLKQAKEVP